MFDTGSSWTWVYTLEGCEENGNQCPSVEKYSVNLSQTETVSDDRTDQLTLEYAIGEVRGNVVSDKFCFTDIASACLSQPLTFLGVYASDNMQSYRSSGFIGLAPVADASFNLPSFISQLKDDKSNLVPPIFSFFLSNSFLYEGKLTFGAYDLTKYGKKGEAVFWANMGPNHNYWTVNMASARFSTNTKEITISSQYLILDTGTSYTMIPSFDFQNIIEFLQMSYGIDCDSDSDDALSELYFCDCSNQ